VAMERWWGRPYRVLGSCRQDLAILIDGIAFS
jgi:hypothetical protein